MAAEKQTQGGAAAPLPPRRPWSRSWLVGAAAALLAVAAGVPVAVAQHRAPAPALTGQRRVPTASASSSPPVVTASPTLTPSAAAASGLQLDDRTATATWSDDQGYDYEATVTLGHLVAYQAGLTLNYPGAGGKLVAGSACQLTPGRDAIIPGQLTAYNETANFTADVSFNLIYRRYQPYADVGAVTSEPTWNVLGRKLDDPNLLTEIGFGGGPACTDNTYTASEGVNVTCSRVAPFGSCSTLFFIVIKGYFGPLHPNGDVQPASQLGISVAHGVYGSLRPKTITGPDAVCDVEGMCAVSLKTATA